MKILISGAGTSDPVRGDHDGGLLHILRFYRPEKVYLFLTDEIQKREKEDQRFELMQKYIQENWDGYNVSIIQIPVPLSDPSDLDECSKTMEGTIGDILQQHADDEILFNLSSGTPQMKMILSVRVLDARYNCVGIQVKNPEKAAGTTERVGKNYPVEESFYFNKDEEPDAINRCQEPKMFYLQRKAQEDQLRALLKRYDYAAIRKLNLVKARLIPLIDHLSSRSELNTEKAEQYAQTAKQKNHDLFSLYPYFVKGSRLTSKYQEKRFKALIEYYLAMRNLQKAGQYNDFILRLNPFMVNFEMMYVEKLLPYPLKDIGYTRNGRYFFSRNKMEVKDPKRLQYIEQAIGNRYVDGDPSQYILSIVLETFDSIPGQLKALFQDTLDVNRKRNLVAHQLECATDQDIEAYCGLNSRGLCLRIEDALQTVFPECNAKIFEIYDRCNDYIVNNLN